MGCDCNDQIENLQCQIDALKQNQDVLWDNSFNNEPYYMYFAGDIGDASKDTVQNLRAYLLSELNLHGDRFLGFIAGGDLNYPSGGAATIDANLLPFQDLIAAKKFFPVLGNHDIDGAGDGLILTSRFTYLPQNGPSEESSNRVYYLDFRDKINAVFYILDQGYKTSTVVGELVTKTFASPDSIDAQKTWMYDSMSNLNAKYNIAALHCPFLENKDEGIEDKDHFPEWDIEFAQSGVDFVLNGHSHTNTRITRDKTSSPFNSLEILNCSAFKDISSNTYDIDSTPWADTPAGFEDSFKFFGGISSHVIKMTFLGGKVITSFVDISDFYPDPKDSIAHQFIK